MATKTLLAILVFLFINNSFAQSPQAFNYQAIVRNGTGTVLQNQNVKLRISILQGGISGTSVFSEEHTTTTSQFGLVNIKIGNGTLISGDFLTINWSLGSFFIKLEIDVTGGNSFTDMGASQLLSVPFAMYAASGNQGPPGQNGISLSWLGTFTLHPTTPLMNQAYYNSTDKKSYIFDGVGWQIIAQDGMQGLQGVTGPAGTYVAGNGINIHNDTISATGISSGTINGTQNRIAKFTSPTSVGNSLFYENGNYVGLGTSAPVGKLVIQGDSLTNDSVPLFEVKDKSGKTVFVVWPDGAHVYVSGTSSGMRTQNRGSFAVSGKSSAKNLESEYFSVNSDSISATKSLYIPRLTTTERDNLGFTPSDALIIFNMTDECMQIFKNGVWSNIWCFHCAPTIITQPFNATVCDGQDTSFTISSTGTSLNYQWQISTDGGIAWNNVTNGGTNPSYSGANSWTLLLSNILANNNGYKYRCMVNSTCPPGIPSNVATLNVGTTAAIVIITQPADLHLITGCDANFNITTSTYGQCQWQQSTNGGSTWNDISDGGTAPVYVGTNTLHLSISNIPLYFNNYKYRCVVNNVCGTGNTSANAILYISAPTALTATNLNHFSFTANWSVITGATDYFLDVSTGSNFATFVSGFNNLSVGNVSNYGVSGLNANATYYYRIRADFTCGGANSNTITASTTAFSIGESYGGGIIFYIDGTGQHGFISATSDQNTGAPWGCWGTAITGADGAAIGTGNQNTVDIEAGCTPAGSAADIAANLVLNGQSDWYLPSLNELNQMYLNKSYIGGFSNNFYWSSSEVSANNAWEIYFGNGNQVSDGKNFTNYVRCIRSF